MFDIGFSELMVIGIVALVVIGPERLPRVARTLGVLFGRLQRYVTQVKSDINREMDLSEINRVKSEFEGAARSFKQDIETTAAKTEQELREDVQLSVYQMGARESWGLETSAQSYFYVLTGERVPVEHSEEELERVRATVTEIATGILKQRFEPTPSPDVCSYCDYRIICPAAEK